MAVPVKSEAGFNPGAPATLFRGTYASLNVNITTFEQNPWDISLDGKRFLMIKEQAPAASQYEVPRRINIVLNWTEELKQRVPVK